MDDLRRLLAIHRIPRLKGSEKLILADLIDTSEKLLKITAGEIRKMTGKMIPEKLWNPRRFLEQADRDRNYLTIKGITYTFYWDSGYPPQLREIYDPPFGLFTAGSMPVTDLPALGIVGTRKPGPAGIQAAYALGKDAVRAGIPVISGLALGIDGAAHRGVLDGGGKTAAVLGCGIDRFYPKSHAWLASRMINSGGCVMSEYPPGEPPLKYHFPERNRIIAGLCRGVAVIEAPEKSGALITADYALEEGRDLFVHSAGLKGMNRFGCESLFRQGAPVISAFSDIARLWGLEIKEPLEVRRGWSGGSSAASTADAGKQAADDLKNELFCPK
ncbi:MAG: DNA-processing protein DprA [Spirochaetia bacterium]